MGNVCAKKKGVSRKLTLAIVGLDNAGKTVTTKGLRGEPVDNVAPTIGFSYVEFKLGGHEITLYDLGGGKKIRDIWKSYFAEIYALVYVIDASDVKRMDECKHVLSNLLQNSQVRGKPILVLANKQDKEGALDEIDICEQLSLEELVNINQCPCRVEMCSALLGQGKKMDPAIRKGMLWLLQIVDNMWDKLHERVQKDVAEKQEREARERKEKMERVEKMRKERAKKEKEERRQRGEDTASDDEDDNNAPLQGDPFKRLDYEELQKREQQLKAQKNHENKNINSSVGNNSDSANRLPLRNRRRLNPRHFDDDDDEEEEVPHQQAIKSTQSEQNSFAITNSTRFPNNYSKPAIRNSPHLAHTLEPLHSKYDDNSSDSDGKPHHRTPRPDDLKLSSTLPSQGSRGLGAGEEEAEGRNLRRKLAPLVPLGSLEPLERAGKKKKKKAKRNQTVPDSIDQEVDVTYQGKNTSFAPRSWSTSNGHRSSLKASKSPELETLREPESERSDTENFSAKWGLDLPDFAPSSHGNLRPNYESDSDIVT